jgi:hypothetical protein
LVGARHQASRYDDHLLAWHAAHAWGKDARVVRLVKVKPKKAAA